MQRLRESIGGKNRFGGTKADRIQLVLSTSGAILDSVTSQLTSRSATSTNTSSNPEKMAATNDASSASAAAPGVTSQAPVHEKAAPAAADVPSAAAKEAIAAEEETKTFKVGVILGSNRKPARAGPQITQFVWDTIKAHQEASEARDSSRTKIELSLIDIDEWDFPFFNEPLNPAAVKMTEQYTHELTKKWSNTIRPLDAYVFVTPQYNWGIPAGLKNAIDFLYHEWGGKSGMIVSYGGHGGGKAAEALKTVLGGGLKMKMVEKTVNLSFPGPGREFLLKANFGEDLGLDANKEEGLWIDQKPVIIGAWESMLMSLNTSVGEA